MSSPPQIFDRQQVRRQRQRALTGFGDYDFLFAEVADRTADRLADVNRRFERVLHIGGARSSLNLPYRPSLLVKSDLTAGGMMTGPGAVVADEELSPFADESFDLVVATLSLHWVNDLPGALVQINRSLKPDGLFIGSLLGGDSLHELRHSLTSAEERQKGGAHQRVAPMVQVRDMGGLLQRAGFALPVSDSDLIEVSYENAGRLLADLKGMGEANALTARPRGLTHGRLFGEALEHYLVRYGREDGTVPATFEVVYLTGWAPGPGQPKPKRPGSATVRLADALGTKEISTGVKTGQT